MKQVYFDNSATTRIRDEVIEVMTQTMRNEYGNASSTHSYGRSSKSLVEKSRRHVANRFNVSPGEIIFTSGGTEADNLILQSAVRDLNVVHIITSRIEHHAVLHTLERLQSDYNILTSPKKTLVSLMHINNEIGTIMDIQRVADLCLGNDALFHSDTVQSVGHYPLDLQKIGIDFLVASAHKFHGPKGVGFAFIRRNSGLKPLILGGEQERGYRAGTECVHNIVGQDEALKIAYEKMEEEKGYIKNLKAYFITQLKAIAPEIKFNGCSDDLERSTYNAVNLRLPVDAKKASMLLFQLDLKGIACSKGSACQSGSVMSSHVLQQILSKEDLEKPSVRFSFSVYNTKEEIDYVVSVLKEFIEK